MGFFSSKKKVTDSTILLVDVRSSSIGASFVRVQNDIPSTPFIAASARMPFETESEPSLDALLIKIQNVMTSMIHSLIVKEKQVPDDIVVVLGSPWYASQSRRIIYKKNAPFIVSHKLLQELIDKEIVLFKEWYSKEHDIVDIEIIENVVQKITLNGYDVTDPYDKKTQEMEISILVSLSPAIVARTIRSALSSVFHARKVNFVSFGSTAFTALRDSFPETKESIIVDIGAEVTDIVVVKKEVLMSCGSAPAGYNALYRSIDKGMVVSSIKEAKSHFLMMCSGHGNEQVSKKCRTITDTVGNAWLEVFQKTLLDLSTDLSLPSTVFLMADDDVAPWYQQVLKREELHQYVLSEKEFNVIIINKSAIWEHVRTNDQEALVDPYLILESIFINRFISSNNHAA